MPIEVRRRSFGPLAAGLGAEVRYWSRHRKEDSGFRYQDLDALLREADFVSVNLALTDRTRGVIGGVDVPSQRDVCTGLERVGFDVVFHGDLSSSGRQGPLIASDASVITPIVTMVRAVKNVMKGVGDLFRPTHRPRTA